MTNSNNQDHAATSQPYEASAPFLQHSFQREQANRHAPPPYAEAQHWYETQYHSAPAPYAVARHFSAPAPYALQHHYSAPAPYAETQHHAPPPYAESQYGAPPPYAHVESNLSPAPYGANFSQMPAPYAAAPAPYGHALHEANKQRQGAAPMGWSMWRFCGESWDLIEDRSHPGGEPSTPERASGAFVGQIVRTPSQPKREANPDSSQGQPLSECEISDIISRVAEVPGYASEQELRWIFGTAAGLKPGSTWAEVGAYCGRSFLAAGLSLPSGSTLITVDLYLGQQYRRGLTLLDAYKELTTIRNDLHVMMLRSESGRVSSLLSDHSCDLVYIDGDHSGSAVRRDIHSWVPKIKQGGMLCGHDYGRPEFPGLTEAVDQLQGSFVAVDSIWAWHP